MKRILGQSSFIDYYKLIKLSFVIIKKNNFYDNIIRYG